MIAIIDYDAGNIKSVEKGETDIGLGNEEKEALEQALGY